MFRPVPATIDPTEPVEPPRSLEEPESPVRQGHPGVRFLEGDLDACAPEEALNASGVDQATGLDRSEVAERPIRGFMNTTVVRGRAETVVTATGMTTETGRVAGLMNEAGTSPTPLQGQLARAPTRILSHPNPPQPQEV